MDDARIVELFWQRDESALTETETKYGRYCLAIADGILHNDEDAQECVNDAYLGAWNTIPPHKPAVLSTILGKITRRLALKKWRDASAEKRGGGATELSLSELEELVPAGQSIDESLSEEELARIVADILLEQPIDERRVFMRRYWFFDSIGDISARFLFSESKVKSMLKRMRDRLAVRLRKEGVLV